MDRNDYAYTVRVVQFSGDLDYGMRERVRQELASLHDADVAVVDLREVPYADSSFINALMALRNEIAKRGTPFAVRLVGANASLRRAMEILQLNEFVEYWDSLCAARSSGIVTKP
jgi:anti-anti-sigma factor